MNETLEFILSNAESLTVSERHELECALKLEHRGFRSNRYIDTLRPNLTPGHPKDNPKQRVFLGLDCLEAMYGGSGGGAKTESIILAGLQYVDIPKYSALIIMETFADLEGADAALHRVKGWLSDFEEVRFHAKEYAFKFPTQWHASHIQYVKNELAKVRGCHPIHVRTDEALDRLGHPPDSQLSFGYLSHSDDKYKYKSRAYQYIAFDELTRHAEESSYTYLFSRLRKPDWMDVPLRVRSGTNPGDVGHIWVRDRFVPDEFINSDSGDKFDRIWEKSSECGDCLGTGVLESDDTIDGSGECFYCGGTGERVRVFVPALAKDNPSLDRKQYAISLAELSPIERARMQQGDWSVVEEGNLFQSAWFRSYRFQGDHLRCYKNDSTLLFSAEKSMRFLTADTASKEKTTADYTVICAWVLCLKTFSLALLDVFRERIEVPKIAPEVLRMMNQHRADYAIIEDAASGIAVIQQLRAIGVSIKPFVPSAKHGDKVDRSTVAQIRMESEQIFFPADRPHWLSACESELLIFGSSQGHDDFVDNVSMAASHAATKSRIQSTMDPPGKVSTGPLEAREAIRQQFQVGGRGW